MDNQRKFNFIKFLTTLVTLGLAAYKIYEILKALGLIDQFQKYAKRKSKNLDELTVAKLVTEISENIRTNSPLKSPTSSKKVKSPRSKSKNSKSSPRAEALLAYIKNKKQITMAQIRDRFPTVTSRTLRRDLEKLEQSGFIAQSGRTKNSTYSVV